MTIQRSLSSQEVKQSTLFLIATPIGNQQELSFRSIQVLKKVHHILCEDTRKTQLLLKKNGIVSKKLISYHRFNEQQQLKTCWKLLQDQQDLVLVSDAGTPVIADPGARLVRWVQQNHFRIEPVGSSCAAVTAFMCSGIISNSFYFVGFLPRTNFQRMKYFKKLSKLQVPIIFYESPKRIMFCINNIVQLFPHAELFVAKDIAKNHQTFIWGDSYEVQQDMQQVVLKGEFTVVMVFHQWVDKTIERKQTKKILESYQIAPQISNKIIQDMIKAQLLK